MGIYIFEPSGAVSTPTLQQVLTAGNTLTSGGFNSININTGTFQIYNGTLLLGGSSDIVTCGDTNKSGYFTIDNSSSGGSTNIIGCYQESPTAPGFFLRNCFLINPLTNLFYIGDYAELNQKGWLSVDNANIVCKAEIYEIREANAGNGVISIKGTGYISATAGGTSGDHLIIEVNGNIRKINLLLP